MTRLNTWKWRTPPHDGSRPLADLPCVVTGCEGRPRWVVNDEEYTDVSCSRHLYSVLDQWMTMAKSVGVRRLTKADKELAEVSVVVMGMLCTRCGRTDHTSSNCPLGLS